MVLKTRVNNLDYLRGLMALGIMIYHFSSWTFGSFESDSILGVIGIYGVSIFYVLSGLTLYLVYNDRLTLKSTGRFFVKRVFRIYPLLWLSIILTLLVVIKSFQDQPIFLNLTGVFGFIAPSNYIANGSWSIGNELVFYVIFPLVIIFDRLSKIFVEIFFLASLIIGSYFAFELLSNQIELSKQWNLYVNPFNQLFLFCGGMVIGKLINVKRNNTVAIFIVLMIGLFLVFNPFNGNQINIVTGWNRLLFSSLAFALTISFLLFDIKLPKTISLILSELGHVSYSLYLLHAIVFWSVARYINRGSDTLLFFIVAVSITMILSFLSYYLLEKKMMKIGTNLTKTKKHEITREIE